MDRRRPVPDQFGPQAQRNNDLYFYTTLVAFGAILISCDSRKPTYVESVPNRVDAHITAQPACINPIGTLIGVGSTVGDDTCIGAFTRVDPDGAERRYSTFDWINPVTGASYTVCKVSQIRKNGEIINPNEQTIVGNSCADVLGITPVDDGE